MATSITFWRVVAFVMKAQIRHIFRAQNSLAVLGRIVFVALAALYAFGFGFGILHAERFGLDSNTLLWSVNIGIAALTFMKSYLPAYQTTSQPIASFYPMSRLQKAFMGVALDMLSLFPLAMALFYGLMFSVSFAALSALQILTSIVFFVTALALDRSLRLTLEYKVRARAAFALVVLCLAAVLFFAGVGNLPFAAASISYFSQHSVVPLLCGLTALLHGALALESVMPQTERASERSSRAVARAYSDGLSAPLYAVKAFFSGKHVYMLFSVAALFKVGLLLYFVVAATRDLELSPLVERLLPVYVAPIPWFTYILNNSFGMNWQVWQNYEQIKGNSLQALKLYLLYSLVAVGFDALLTFSVLLYFGALNSAVVVIWLSCLLTFWAWGYIVAVLAPIKVERLTSSIFMSLRSVSSTGGMVGVVAGLAIIAVLSAFHRLLPLALPVIAISGAVYIFLHYSRLKHKLYDRIHRS